MSINENPLNIKKGRRFRISLVSSNLLLFKVFGRQTNIQIFNLSMKCFNHQEITMLFPPALSFPQYCGQREVNLWKGYYHKLLFYSVYIKNINNLNFIFFHQKSRQQCLTGGCVNGDMNLVPLPVLKSVVTLKQQRVNFFHRKSCLSIK